MYHYSQHLFGFFNKFVLKIDLQFFIKSTLVQKRAMKKLLLSAVLICALAVVGNGQDTRNTRKPNAPVYQSQKKKEKKSISLRKLFEKEKTDQEEFRERLKQVYKQKAKEEKLAEKPQYSNPLYFGHKKPPKKRPAGKQKFCKICKIKH